MSLVRTAADILAEIGLEVPEEGDMKVTDIDIVKVFEVRCPLCQKTVATAGVYQDAIMRRRDHFFGLHRRPR